MAAAMTRRVQWALLGIAAFLCLLLPLPPAGAAAKPERIVSLNLCTDQLVLMLAERERIASVTFLSLEPASYMADAARGLHLNHGRAEEILPLRPDLVLAGRHAARTTVELLRRFGLRVVTLDAPRSFAEVAAQVRRVAALLGEAAKGEALIARMNARLAAVAPLADGARPGAVLYLPSGATSGAGTMTDLVLRAAGYRNLAAELGIRGTSPLPLERLLLAGPDILVFSSYAPGVPSQAEALLRHPALRRTMQETPAIFLPSRLWMCPGPMLAEAVGLLVRARP